ncbi:hypothetical protein MACK_001897 [Theileria orientalis]|uniref:Chorein N-terminal domain-containing protein n=1 Tax=Theileria orientalis TaxID=68886 RepID=A0A976QSN7_THEOR|nr:hypothetical protein MACK_001897 [Theileria orientalis]
MFEGLVKRMLDTYLAPYVDGITQNLQMAVWSGNISLENLTLKDDITSRLALPFHDVSGKIGSINIRIPWASIGTTPIKIVIDSVYICIDNRSTKKTDEEILAHLRKKKNNLIGLLEHEYFELANLQSEGKLSSSYIIKLSQKILNNIQIDFTNIHLQFFDEHSSFAFKIDSIFVRKSRGDESRKSLRLKTNDEFREEPVTHVCSLLGFSIYETKFNIPKEKINSKAILQIIVDQNSSKLDDSEPEENTGLLMLEPLSFRLYLAINAKNKSIYASLCIGSIVTNQSRLTSKDSNYRSYIRNITQVSNKNNRESDPVESESDIEDEDTLKIVLTSDVIRTFTKMWVDINMDRKRGRKLLMAKENEVKLDHESLKKSTKAEFIKLYTKYRLNTTEVKEEDAQELERLQDLIDLVPARYIARWKFACKRRTSAQVVTKENKSWFKWAKNIVTTTYTNYHTSRNAAKNEESPSAHQDQSRQKRSFRPSFFSLNLNNTFSSSGRGAPASPGSESVKEVEGPEVSGDASSTQVNVGADNYGGEYGDPLNSERANTSDFGESDFIDGSKDMTDRSDRDNGIYFDSVAGEKMDSGSLGTNYKGAEGEKHMVLLENLPGGLVLTEDEIKMIQETISLEELFEDSYTTSSYYFECVLPAFQFIVHMLNQSGGKTARSGEDNIMLIDIQNLQSRLFMHAVVDMKDKDRYEGYFDLNLDSFDVILKNKKIMTFSQQNLPFQSIVDTYIDHASPESLSIVNNDEGIVTQSGVGVTAAQNDGVNSEGREDGTERLRLLQTMSETEKCIMNLRVYHKIAKKGNVLVVNGELRPIETNVFPELIPVFFELMSLFKPIKKIFNEDFKMDAYSYSTCASNITLGSVTNEEEEDEVLSSTHESAETVRELDHSGTKDMDSIQFINFDIKFSAPILILYYENSRIDFYFGTLVLKSNGDCPIANIDGTLELKQTQVTCNYMEKTFNFLRPLPVKIHYYLDLKNELMNLNVIFEEIFAQLEPMATSILFKVPSEIIKILIKNMTQESQSGDEASELRSQRTYRRENKLKYYKICSNVLIRHSGFSVANLNLHDIFKLDMYNVSIKMTNTLEHSNFNLSLESIIISNPTTKIPLFKTINANPGAVSSRFSSIGSYGYSSDYMSESELSIVKFSSIGEGNEGEVSDHDGQNSENLSLSKKNSLREGDSVELEEEYVDAIEDVSKSLDLEILTNIVEETVYNVVNISIIEMEGNWEYSTIKLIADGFQEYKDVLTNNITDTTFTTITTTFKTFKDKFMFHTSANLGNQGVRGGKQGENVQEDEDYGDDIEGFCIHDELPLLQSELKERDVMNDLLDDSGSEVSHRSRETKRDTGEDSDGLDLSNSQVNGNSILTNDPRVVTKCKVVIKGASVMFNNSTGDIIAKLSVGRIVHQLSKFKNNEKIIKLVIQTGKLYFGGRCILSHLSTTADENQQGSCSGIGSEKSFEFGKMGSREEGGVYGNGNGNISSRDDVGVSESDNLLVLNLKCYNSMEMPYSMCFEGKVDKLVFVYFQHDINRFMEYFDDGILSVFLSKSYHKVVQRADEMRFFYHFSITSPIFIFPENKAVLPNGRSYYKQELPPGSTLPLYVNNESGSAGVDKNGKNGNVGKPMVGRNEVPTGADKQIWNIASVVDLWYFGSYILFELGHLEFKNSYSKLVDSYKSTIFLKMLGTKAQIIQQKNGTTGIEGVVLDATDLKVCTRGRNLMEIGIDSEALVTKLTRNQLTFIIDVFNENIGGAVYMVNEAGTSNFTQNFPTKRESRYLIRLSLNKFQLYCYNNLNSNREVAENREYSSGDSKQVRFANMDAKKDEIIPLGLFEFTDITCCLDYASNNVKLLSYYQFGFISKSLTVTDLRENSFNKYKTLLKCNKPSRGGTSYVTTCGSTNEMHSVAKDGSHGHLLSHEDREKEDMKASVNGLLFEWLRNYKNRTGTDFFKINEGNFAAKTGAGTRGDEYKGANEEDAGSCSGSEVEDHEDAIKCVVNSDPEESLIDVIVSNSEIPLLFVFFFDLLRFFSLSYGTSSMALFPKISQVNVERVYILNLLVSKSKFISFSKMDKVDCPRLELVTDFILQMYVNGNSFKFTKLDIIDCLLSRVYPNTNISQVLCANFLMYGKGHYLSDVASKMFFQFTIPQINLRLYTRDLSIIIYCFKSMFTDGPSVIPVKLVNNQLIDDNSSKFLTMSFDIKGLEMLFFDDLKKSIIPLVKLTVESEKLEILNLPIEKRYSLIRCNCHLYYFNTNVGDWEPFIEKFIFNLEYITNPSGNGVSGSMNKRTGNQMTNRMNAQMDMMSGKRASDDAIWKDFVSEYQLKITCNNNLMVNITPNFCQMLLYFLPILKSNLLHPPFMNNPNDLKAQQHPGQSGQLHLDGREDDDIEMSNYRYVNLTSYEYYGFIMDMYKTRRDAFSDVFNIVGTTTPKQLDSLVNQLDKEMSSNEYCIYLVTKPPKYVLKQMAHELNCNEKLVQNDLLTSGSIMRTRSNLSNLNYASSHSNMNTEFNRSLFFNNGMVLSNIPLSKNCTVLLSVPIKDIRVFTALYMDGEARGDADDQAFSQMSSINTEPSRGNSTDYETINSIGSANRTIGSDRNSVEAVGMDSDDSNGTRNGSINTEENVTHIDPSLNAMNPNSTLSSSQLNHRGSFLHNNMITGRSSNATFRNSTMSNVGAEGTLMSRNNRVTNINDSIVNDNIICQVLSPHPSHKLLLFTSTVRIYNKSGMPMVMCFLDYGFNHQYMYNLDERTIPCNLLNQNDMQNFKQYTAGNIYSDLSEVSRHSTSNGAENDEGYFVVIPNDHMLSVPENVFLSESQIIFSFKPLYRAKDREDIGELFSKLKRSMDNEPNRKQYYNKLVNTTGWCKMIDSSHHSGTRVRQCYCPDLGKNGFLYFVVSVDNKRSSLPANVNISEIVIYPSISVMNTMPIDLDIKLLSKDYNLQATKYARDTQTKEDITYKLNRKGILHIYSVPPNESLSLYIRLSSSALEDMKLADGRSVVSEWCTRIDNIYGNSDSRSMFTIVINGSVLELELIRFAGALPVNNLCIQGHLSLIINAPWLFIDRTGLNLVPQHYNRIFTLNNLSFLYDNNNNNYKLVSLNNPGAARYSVQLDRRYSSSRHSGSGYRPDEYFDDSEYDIKMPIIGGYGYTSIEIKGKRHCVCLITEKVYIPGLSHISSKITSALPEYLFTNNLTEVVYLRKDARSESIQIMPNSTQSISHLTNVNYLMSQNSGTLTQMGRAEYKENCIEIKVGMETCWSNVIYLNEIHSGETFMSLSKENSSKSQVYNITIIPKNGIKYIAINASLTPLPSTLSASERTNDIRGYLLYNNSREIKVVMIRTFHKKDVKNGACFTAKYGQVINFGWPNPFVHKSKLVQVLLWLDKNTVAPSKPLIFNFSTPSFRFRRIELTTPEYHTNYNITILAENRIDYYIIIINPNAVGPQSPLTQVSTSASPLHGGTASMSIGPNNVNSGNNALAASSVTAASQLLNRSRDLDLDEIDDNVLLDNKHISDIKNEDMYVFDEEASIRSYQVVLQISQIGVSIVSQSQHEELFFLEMGGIMSLFMCKEDHQRLELKITDVQLDNQTELDMGKTILVNRSKVETSDANFLQVYIDRPFSNCKDISIKKMFVSLDDLQVDFNDLLFTKMHSYYKECMINLFNDTQNSGSYPGGFGGYSGNYGSVFSGYGVNYNGLCYRTHFSGITGNLQCSGIRGADGNSANTNDQRNAGNRPGYHKGGRIDIEVIEGWLSMEKNNPTSSIEVNVNLPRSISIDYLYIEAFSLVVWCCFELEKLHMLGDLLRVGLRILSVSRNFELMGAPISFQREYVTISRTSVLSFWEQMKDKYLQASLSCIGSILGYSNLLNIPKLPLTVGRCTIELAADAVDSVSSGLGLVLSKFTFDKEYMKKRSTAKEVTSIKDGLYSAGKTIGEGLFSLTNIVTKPIEGAQKEGVEGFIKGLGKGLLGSIVKPIDKVGIAVSQVSRGIKANISKEEKFLVDQCRKPRMLWGEFAQIRGYSTQDAEIRDLLGVKYAKHIMDCLLIIKQQTGSKAKQVALLFYPSKVYLVDLSQSHGKRPYTIWKLQITNITEVRASSHGVIIKCGLEQYQVPCTRADMISNIHNSFQRAIKHASSQITLGPELFISA